MSASQETDTAAYTVHLSISSTRQLTTRGYVLPSWNLCTCKDMFSAGYYYTLTLMFMRPIIKSKLCIQN